MSLALHIRLSPTAPWRIGPDSGDRDRVDRVLHSDALYSAVSSAMARLDRLEAWLDATARAEEPAVRFSSCFPMLGGVPYVVPPRNLWPPVASSKVRWKGARFVPLSVVESLLQGKPLSDEAWMIDVASECLIPANPPGGQGPFRVAVRSAAAVDRQGEAVAPHSTACLEFAPDAGMWAVALFSSEEAKASWQAPLEAALRLLADSGFGGERSSGWGRAAVTTAEQALPSFPESGESGWWMLSLFHPSGADQVDWDRGNYAVTTRSGRVESSAGWGEAKRATRMIAEGSVLAAASEPKGSVSDVAPEGFPHPVFRAGYAVAVRIPLKGARP